MKNTNVSALKFADSNYLAFLTTKQIRKEVSQTKAVFEILLVEKLSFLFFGCRSWAYLIILLSCGKFSKTYLIAIWQNFRHSFRNFSHAPPQWDYQKRKLSLLFQHQSRKLFNNFFLSRGSILRMSSSDLGSSLANNYFLAINFDIRLLMRKTILTQSMWIIGWSYWKNCKKLSKYCHTNNMKAR